MPSWRNALQSLQTNEIPCEEVHGMTRIKLCDIEEFDGEDKLQVEVDGHEPFAVYEIEGQYFVTEDTCTHGKASLADEGELEGFEIECTWHDGRFDVRTGEATTMPCSKPLKTFTVTREADSIYIDIET